MLESGLKQFRTFDSVIADYKRDINFSETTPNGDSRPVRDRFPLDTQRSCVSVKSERPLLSPVISKQMIRKDWNERKQNLLISAQMVPCIPIWTTLLFTKSPCKSHLTAPMCMCPAGEWKALQISYFPSSGTCCLSARYQGQGIREPYGVGKELLEWFILC